MFKKTVTAIIFLLYLIQFSIADQKTKKFRFLSLKNIHIYGMAASIHINPINPYDFTMRKTDFTFVPGAGFTAIYFGNRLKLNIDMDSANSTYDFITDFILEKQKIRFLNINSNIEFVLKNMKSSVFAGIGISLLKFSIDPEWGASGQEFMFLNIGFKHKILKYIKLRSEFRYLFEPSDYEYDPYYEEYYSTGNGSAIGAHFSIGLEIALE